MDKNKIKVEVIQGCSGKALYINGYRVCGGKPWGGGKTLYEFDVDKDELEQALGINLK